MCIRLAANKSIAIVHHVVTKIVLSLRRESCAVNDDAVVNVVTTPFTS